MKRKTILWLITVCCSLWFAAVPYEGQNRKESDLAVVVHPDTPISSLSTGELRKIFRGERQYWTKDMPVVLLVRAPVSRERDAVVKGICQMTESQFKQYWIARIFRAEAVSPPIVVYTNQAMNDILATVPGAIAVVDQHDVRPGLKVLRVENHAPGDSDYSLWVEHR